MGIKGMDYQEFSEKVKSLGMKRTEFVRYLGMSNNAYTKWSMENRVPYLVGLHLDLLCKVATLLPDLSQFKKSALGKGDGVDQ